MSAYSFESRKAEVGCFTRVAIGVVALVLLLVCRNMLLIPDTNWWYKAFVVLFVGVPGMGLGLVGLFGARSQTVAALVESVADAFLSR